MLTAVQLRSQVDQLWDKLWSGGLSNPLDAIEQFSYLLFLKRIDDEENARERQARLRGQTYQSRVPDNMRWGTWTHRCTGRASRGSWPAACGTTQPHNASWRSWACGRSAQTGGCWSGSAGGAAWTAHPASHHRSLVVDKGGPATRGRGIAVGT